MKYSSRQIEIIDKLKRLKAESGSHSPSISTIRHEIPELNIEIDACFLSNPYATELFLNYLMDKCVDRREFRQMLEYYPSQNREIAKYISSGINVPANNIFVGNGAIEIIQALLTRYVTGRFVVNIPTFSSYYEFANSRTEVVYYNLKKENDYLLDLENYVEFVIESQATAVVIINPNNPNGGYVDFDTIENLLDRLRHLDLIIVDESFIHFANEDDHRYKSTEQLLGRFKNLVVVKSMSKDFGIAGIRAGYAVTSSSRVDDLLSTGYLWNINGIAEYFFELYSNKVFLEQYEICRAKYIDSTAKFINELTLLDGIYAYPSKANFVLIELLNGMTADDFVMRLLITEGIYVRNCSDKIGLNGEFVRVAARTMAENESIITAIKNVLL